MKLGKNNGEGFMDRRNMIGLGLAAAAMPKFALADTVMPGDGSVPSDPKEIVTLWPGTPPGGAGETSGAAQATRRRKKLASAQSTPTRATDDGARSTRVRWWCVCV